jgi:hypothetical protein
MPKKEKAAAKKKGARIQDSILFSDPAITLSLIATMQISTFRHHCIYLDANFCLSRQMTTVRRKLSMRK